MQVDRCRIVDNRAMSILVLYYSSINASLISGTFFHGSKAGAIFAYREILYIDKCTFTANNYGPVLSAESSLITVSAILKGWPTFSSRTASFEI